MCTDAFAGVERLVARLAVTQLARGHEVVVVGGDPASMREEFGAAAVQHVAAATVTDVTRALNALKGADVINVHMTAAEIAAAAAHRVRRVPVVSTRHFAGTRGSSSLAARLVSRTTARRIRAQIAVSSFVAAHVEGASTVVWTGVPEQRPGPAAGERGRRVLVAQRLEAEKATDVALRAFGQSGLQEEGWVLDVAGEGALRAVLERLAKELGLGDSVRFLGHRRDIDRLMGAAAILVAPCDREALGLTVVEAMAHALPVVASAAGGHLETLGPVEGAAMFEPGDVAGAAELLRALAHDPEERAAYGRALQRRQREHFTLRTQAEGTEAVYRGVT
jgi:glycosyltransferase involved in cell wall biosynthesis